MTCYEYLRKKNKEHGQEFKRLQGYFKALENNNTDKYHDKQDQLKKNRQKRLKI